MRLDPGQGLAIIIPLPFQANMYTFTSVTNKKTTSMEYLISSGWYFVVVPNIFHDYLTATACLYLYAENNKLIALQQVANNGLTSMTKVCTLHIDLQKLLTK